MTGTAICLTLGLVFLAATIWQAIYSTRHPSMTDHKPGIWLTAGLTFTFFGIAGDLNQLGFQIIFTGGLLGIIIGTAATLWEALR